MHVRRSGAALALALTLAGCSTTKLDGVYDPRPATAVKERGDRRVLGKGGKWLFFWGLLDTGDVDVQGKLRDHTRPGEVVKDVTVTDRLSIGGALLWLITGGIVSHHAETIRGTPALPAPPAPPTTHG